MDTESIKQKKRDQGFQVHQLIHKFSSNEKAYFIRLNSANKKSSKMIMMYDFLNRQDIYDPGKTKVFLAANEINRSSIYTSLKTALIKSLRQYHTNTSVSLQLNALLSDIEILYMKGLLQLTKSMIKKGLRIADENEKSHYSLIFRYWRLVYYFASSHDPIKPSVIEEQQEEIDFYIEELRKVLSINYLSKLMDSIVSSEVQDYTEATAGIREKVLTHQLISDQQLPVSRNGLYAYYDLLASSHFYLENWPDCMKFSKILYHVLMTGDPNGKGEEVEGVNHYRQAMLLTNLMAISNLLKDTGQYNVYKSLFNEVMQLSIEDKDYELIRRICIPRFTLQELSHTMVTKEFKKGDDIVYGDLRKILAGETNLVASMKILAEVANFYFVFEKHDECLKYCNMLHSTKELKKETDIMYALLWMEVISFYELREESLFISKHRSFYHYAKEGRGRSFHFERLILTALKKSFGLSEQERRMQIREILPKVKLGYQEIAKPTTQIDLFGWLVKEAGDNEWNSQ